MRPVKAVPDSEDGRQWVWISFAPEFRLMIAAIVGPRTLDTAKEVVAATKARVAGHPGVLQRWIHVLSGGAHRRLPRRDDVCAHRQAGPPTQARLCAPSGSDLWAVGQTEETGQLLTLSTRVVLGAERLTHLGLTISTALVERVNLTLRQALAPLGRKTYSFCKNRERLRQRVVFFQAFYNVARPHMSLRQPLSTARAYRPRHDSSSMAGANPGDGGRRDGARLDLS